MERSFSQKQVQTSLPFFYEESREGDTEFLELNIIYLYRTVLIASLYTTAARFVFFNRSVTVAHLGTSLMSLTC